MGKLLQGRSSAHRCATVELQDAVGTHPTDGKDQKTERISDKLGAKSAELRSSVAVVPTDNGAQPLCLSPPSDDISVPAYEGFDRGSEMPYLLPGRSRAGPAERGGHRGPHTDSRRVLSAEKGSLSVVDSRARRTGASTAPTPQGMKWCSRQKSPLPFPSASGADWFWILRMQCTGYTPCPVNQTLREGCRIRDYMVSSCRIAVQAATCAD
jgi:hypothetical protein